MRSRGGLTIAVVCGVTLGSSGSAIAARALPALSVLNQTAVSVNGQKGKDTATTDLILFNQGPGRARIALAFEASSAASARLARVAPKSIRSGRATRVKLTFAGLKQLRALGDGELIIAGGATRLTEPVSITPAPQPSVDWPKAIVIGSVVAMFLLYGGIFLASRGKQEWKLLGSKAPGPKWSFDSWATTLTAGGAIFGTVLSSATFPDVPRQIDKDSLIRLNLLFGVLVVVAPFVFQAIRRPRASADDQEAGLWGYNWSLLLACSITCGAVLGELAAFALLAWELIGGHTWGTVAVVFSIALGLLAVYYFVVTAWQLATTDWAANVEADKAKSRQANRSIALGVGRAAHGEDIEEGAMPPISPGPAVTRRTWSLP